MKLNSSGRRPIFTLIISECAVYMFKLSDGTFQDSRVTKPVPCTGSQRHKLQFRKFFFKTSFPASEFSLRVPGEYSLPLPSPRIPRLFRESGDKWERVILSHYKRNKKERGKLSDNLDRGLPTDLEKQRQSEAFLPLTMKSKHFC